MKFSAHQWVGLGAPTFCSLDSYASNYVGASLIPLIEGFERSLRAEGGGNGFVPWQESQQASVAPVAQPSGGAGPKSPVAAAPTSPVTAAEPTSATDSSASCCRSV